MPLKVSNQVSALHIPTEHVKHFKSVIDPNSAYSDFAGYVVGYTNTCPITAINPPAPTNPVALSSADFDVDKSYTYLVVMQTGNQSSDRTYDITLTFG